MEMIKVINNKPVLDTATLNKIVEFEKTIKELEEKKKELSAQILEEMESKGLLKIDSEELSISYIAPSERETFDSKSFRADHEDLYDEYVKFSPVKASVRIKVK